MLFSCRKILATRLSARAIPVRRKVEEEELKLKVKSQAQ